VKLKYVQSATSKYPSHYSHYSLLKNTTLQGGPKIGATNYMFHGTVHIFTMPEPICVILA